MVVNARRLKRLETQTSSAPPGISSSEMCSGDGGLCADRRAIPQGVALVVEVRGLEHGANAYRNMRARPPLSLL